MWPPLLNCRSKKRCHSGQCVSKGRERASEEANLTSTLFKILTSFFPLPFSLFPLSVSFSLFLLFSPFFYPNFLLDEINKLFEPRACESKDSPGGRADPDRKFPHFQGLKIVPSAQIMMFRNVDYRIVKLSIRVGAPSGLAGCCLLCQCFIMFEIGFEKVRQLSICLSVCPSVRDVSVQSCAVFFQSDCHP